jgi:hypothetical protein
MKIDFDEILHMISFFFTILIILLAVVKGMDSVELIINILYFTTLNITFINYLIKRI